MQIAQSLQLSLAKTNGLSSSLLTKLVVGQRLEAIVMTPATIAELAKLKIEDAVLHIRSPVPLEQGQKLVLEVVKDETGKLGFKLLPNLPETETTPAKPLIATSQAATPKINIQKLTPEPLPIKAGLVLEAAVVKVLSDKQIVVLPQLVPVENPKPEQTSPAKPLLAKAPALTPSVKFPEIEIDVSALKTVFKPGQPLNIEVVTAQPLTVRLKPAQIEITEQIKQQKTGLIAKLDSTEPSASLKQITTSLKQLEQLPPPLKQQLQQLLQGISEKKVIQQPIQLQQAMNRSGVFLESHLQKQPELVKTDFKANLLKLAQVIENLIDKAPVKDIPAKLDPLKSLPVEIRTILQQLTETPEELNQLPAQITAALSQQGKAPSQLLSTLLSLLGRKIDVSADNVTKLTTSLMPLPQTDLQSTKTTAASQPQSLQQLQQLQNLLKEVQSVTAKVQLNQLSMLKETDGQSQANVWLMDIPVKDKQQLEMMQLRVEQHHGERRASQPKEDTWQVQLNLETQGLGPLQAGVNLYAGTVKVVLNAAWQQSATLLEQHLDLLHERLNELGLSVNQLSCHCVPIKPIVPLSSQAEQQSGSWVDMSV